MTTISPPCLGDSLAEFWRASSECRRLASEYRQLAAQPMGDGHPVLCIPGYGGADGCMLALRYWLKRWHYRAEPWGLGRNMPAERITQLEQMQEFQRSKVAALARRIETLARHSGEQVSLIGWSLGGLYANALAQHHPEHLRQVITLGTPFGDPRGTAAWAVLKRLNRSTTDDANHDIAGWTHHNNGPRSVPTTVLYSPCDGIVSPEIACLNGDNIENIAVRSSHLGFAWNPTVHRAIAQILARPRQR
ncbi:alpha/beta fold hydrolase [Spongiibacter sp. KMU-166]|uniref:Alpha/beta fold hydrolase n=1 Tax=Spongiibacter thalassae TaxID=2721624 RepID=A0ABX1GBA5_9GAMM|nr:alpha/beta fold hydrolase [Spongiibacter thalassae]NKI16201.1 alpha/beta fold hydrolase [Spongiibacter thalassae]